MKILGDSSLPELPQEIKSLVRDGVYSLYEIEHADARYLLITKGEHEYYLLSETGAVTPTAGVKSIADVKLLRAMSFSAGDGSVRINVG
jgi:hypothetical protein